MSNISPIKPSEVTENKLAAIPDYVIEIFNNLITENFDGHSSVIEQKEVIDSIIKRHPISRQEIFRKGFLNVDNLFRKAGWDVEYDKPGYDESYEASWTFTPGINKDKS